MRLLPILLALPILAAACVSDDTAPERTTVVVPNGARVVCQDGTTPPCPNTYP